MKKLRLLGLFFGFVLVGPSLGWSQQDCDTTGDGYCCDPDEVGFTPSECIDFSSTGILSSQTGNQDTDCGPVTADACTIPLDGGLSLLALAGGGLATAAIRRRREEEEAVAQGAA